MSEHGFCPTCGIPWPNFCPLDGKRLSGPWTCANAPKPVIRQPAVPAAETVVAPQPAPAPASQAAPARDPVARPAVSGRAPDLGRPPEPARPAAAAPEPAPEAAPLRRQPDADLLKSFVDNVGARAPIEKSRAPARSRAQDELRTAATLIQPQVTEEMIQQAKARAAERAAPKAAADDPASATEKKKRAKGEFSDTQWFMKGLNLQVANPDTGEVAVDEEAYKVDESISEEERRRFTLRKKDEE